jgi:hypothetical protein
MYLSPHFTLAEFTVSQTASRLGIDNAPTPEALVNLKRTALGLEGIRILLGVPIIITSGYRCLELNRAIGSKDTSQHITGEAADFVAPGFGSPSTVMSRIIDSGLEYDQCILEYADKPNSGWVHISFSVANRHHALIIDDTGTRPYMA